MKKISWKELEKEKLVGKVFVLPTDTIYGFSAMSFDKTAIEKIFYLKKREEKKPLINLIASLDDLEKFNVFLNKQQEEFLKKIWPGPYTIILKNKNEEKISFRMPKKRKLLKFLKKVGPIVSTSLNISGENHLLNLNQLEKKFPELDFYLNEGELKNKPSTILELIR